MRYKNELANNFDRLLQSHEKAALKSLKLPVFWFGLDCVCASQRCRYPFGYLHLFFGTVRLIKGYMISHLLKLR